ncbi:glucose-1-phosphate thymidylyltransferase [Streptomyces sp. NPDC015501]|uniref:glucose-1-phosphate thymidylyltransferase n=1 Tax=unclassified Streptomyces TaxID=2593676 RepID=UPI00119DEF9C|nr:glucose-1-phosphate thymidylyltransferase [Streptomyces griseus subsp. griseus]
MKALVLSGGSGTRLRPISYAMPKQLVPIAGKPVLEYVLENIRDLDIKEVGIVVGDWAQEIIEAIGDGSRFGLRITYIRQDQPLGIAHCVKLAREFLDEDDFVLYLGDIMLDGDLPAQAREFLRARPAARIVVRQVPDPRAFGVIELDAEGQVLRLVEKPREPRSDLAAIGVYFFTADVHRAVDAIRPSARGELEITDAIQWLLEHGSRVEAGRYTDYWKDTGRVEDVVECNRRMLGRLARRVSGEVGPESELLGGVVVEEGARVTRSRIVGPAVIGAGTVVEDSQIGPYASIGRHCTVRASRLSDSIVLDDASILAVAGLHGSLIGRGARVGPGARGEARHRLVVGDHVQIEIAA